MQQKIKLSKAEALLVQISRSDSDIQKQQAEQIMQGRLATITESHDVPNGAEVSFRKEDDGNIYLSYDDGKPDLKLEDGGQREDGGDTSTATAG